MFGFSPWIKKQTQLSSSVPRSSFNLPYVGFTNMSYISSDTGFFSSLRLPILMYLSSSSYTKFCTFLKTSNVSKSTA